MWGIEDTGDFMSQRNTALDATRGMAMLGMLFGHFMMVTLASQNPTEAAETLGWGLPTWLRGFERPAAPEWLVALTLAVFAGATVLLFWFRSRREIGLEPLTRRGVIAQVAILAFFATSLLAPIVSPFRRENVSVEATPTPLATAIMWFFFITGTSMAFMLDRRKRTEDWSSITRHAMLRYSLLLAIGAFVSLILLNPKQLWLWENPVSGIGLTDIVAFPLVYMLNWPALLVAAGILTAVTPFVVLSAVPSSLAGTSTVLVSNIIFVGTYSLTKTLPVVLVGAALGKHLAGGGRLRWQFTALGVAALAISIAAMAILPVRAVFGLFYYGNILMTIGIVLLQLGMADFFVRRRVPLQIFVVLGRAALLTYVLSFILIALLRELGILMMIPFELIAVLALVLVAFLSAVGYNYLALRTPPPTVLTTHICHGSIRLQDRDNEYLDAAFHSSSSG